MLNKLLAVIWYVKLEVSLKTFVEFCSLFDRTWHTWRSCFISLQCKYYIIRFSQVTFDIRHYTKAYHRYLETVQNFMPYLRVMGVTVTLTATYATLQILYDEMMMMMIFKVVATLIFNNLCSILTVGGIIDGCRSTARQLADGCCTGHVKWTFG